MKRGSRVGVLPDFQGIGIAQKILTETAKTESEKYKRHKLFITTSNVFFAKNIKKNKNFVLTSVHDPKKTSETLRPNLRKTDASSRRIFSFRFCGNTNEVE